MQDRAPSASPPEPVPPVVDGRGDGGSAPTFTAAEPASALRAEHPPLRLERLAFIPAHTPEAQGAAAALTQRYGATDPDDADVIVALGGDGLMLSCLHRFMSTGKPTFGLNLGSVGFLMNDFRVEGLHERIEAADMTTIRPLKMRAVDVHGEVYEARAINEVSILRQTYQAAKLAISIDGTARLRELICDGILVATPAGSTAYNLSAHGPILPINAQLLALTPISAFRPRRWRGALLPSHVRVTIESLEHEKRPIAAAADHVEIRRVVRVDVSEDKDASCILMFDPDHPWDERILAEQFMY